MARAGQGDKEGKYSKQYKHMVDALIKMYRTEGFVSMFNGAIARSINHMCTMAIAMGVIEHTKPKI